jgi:two-component system nitrate/nitrite response regulator NarL
VSGVSSTRAVPRPGAGKIRVILADEQPLFRDALGRAIRQDAALELVVEAEDRAALVAAIAENEADAVLLDAALLSAVTPGARRLPRILVLAADVDPAAAYAAVRAGVAGYLSKDAEGAVICRALVAVARGQIVLDSSAQVGLASEIRLRVRRDEQPLLSPREREILAMVAEGRTAPVIAEELKVSTATVKSHLIRLYTKLGVTERAAAVAAAMRRGLLE